MTFSPTEMVYPDEQNKLFGITFIDTDVTQPVTLLPCTRVWRTLAVYRSITIYNEEILHCVTLYILI